MARRVVVVVRQSLTRADQHFDLAPGEPVRDRGRIGDGLDDGILDVATQHEARGDHVAASRGQRRLPPVTSSSWIRYVDVPCTARTSGANCDAMRPFTSTIFAVPSAATKNSMLNSESSKPSAGMSMAGDLGQAVALSGGSSLG